MLLVLLVLLSLYASKQNCMTKFIYLTLYRSSRNIDIASVLMIGLMRLSEI